MTDKLRVVRADGDGASVPCDPALKESVRWFDAFLGEAGLIALVLDADGCIAYCNRCFLELTGWDEDEVVGHDWFELFLPRPHDTTRRVFRSLLDGSEEFLRFENDIVTHGGQRRFVRWHNVILRAQSGQIIGTASIGEPEPSTDAVPLHLPELALEQIPDTPEGIVALTEALHERPREVSLTYLRMIAEQCAQIADESGYGASGPAVARRIRELFRI